MRCPGCISEKPAENKIRSKTDMITGVSIISKEHLDWLKIDLDPAEIIAAQGYMHNQLR